jgi:hypothetical protein
VNNSERLNGDQQWTKQYENNSTFNPLISKEIKSILGHMKLYDFASSFGKVQLSKAHTPPIEIIHLEVE